MLKRETQQKQLRIETALEPLPSLLCRPGKIHQALYNILLNAIQASGPGGAIAVRTGANHDAILIESKPGLRHRRRSSAKDFLTVL